MENKQGAFDWTKVNEVELVYKTKVRASERPRILKSKDIFDCWRSIWNPLTIEIHEEFKILLLNQGNRILGVFHASIGGISGTVADPRLIMLAALKANAVSIILAHNHPSGELTPSKADKELTQKIIGAGRLLDIRVLDHIILTTESYLSFADEGLL